MGSTRRPETKAVVATRQRSKPTMIATQLEGCTLEDLYWVICPARNLAKLVAEKDAILLSLFLQRAGHLNETYVFASPFDEHQCSQFPDQLMRLRGGHIVSDHSAEDLNDGRRVAYDLAQAAHSELPRTVAHVETEQRTRDEALLQLELEPAVDEAL